MLIWICVYIKVYSVPKSKFTSLFHQTSETQGFKRNSWHLFQRLAITIRHFDVVALCNTFALLDFLNQTCLWLKVKKGNSNIKTTIKTQLQQSNRLFYGVRLMLSVETVAVDNLTLVVGEAYPNATQHDEDDDSEATIAYEFEERRTTSVRCLSQGGNPMPVLRLFRGNDDITNEFTVKVSDQRTETVHNVLDVVVKDIEIFSDEFQADLQHHKKHLKCVARIPGHPELARSVIGRINIRCKSLLSRLQLPMNKLKFSCKAIYIAPFRFIHLLRSTASCNSSLKSMSTCFKLFASLAPCFYLWSFNYVLYLLTNTILMIRII